MNNAYNRRTLFTLTASFNSLISKGNNFLTSRIRKTIMEKKNLRNLLLGVSAVVGLCCAGQPAECLFGKTVNYCCKNKTPFGASGKVHGYTIQYKTKQISLKELKNKVCALTGPCAAPTAPGAPCSDENYIAHNSINSALPSGMNLDDKFCPGS